MRIVDWPRVGSDKTDPVRLWESEDEAVFWNGRPPFTPVRVIGESATCAARHKGLFVDVQIIQTGTIKRGVIWSMLYEPDMFGSIA